MSASPANVTKLLARWRAGEADARDDLLPLVYDELRRLAGSHLRRERADHTLQPTELVHEAFLRLFGSEFETADRRHFFALASQVMRRVLVDHARRQQALKRPDRHDRVTLSTDSAVEAADRVDVLDLHTALLRFADLAPRPARLVELRFFGGLTLEEAAQVAQISRATAARDWELARTWLAGELAS